MVCKLVAHVVIPLWQPAIWDTTARAAAIIAAGIIAGADCRVLYTRDDTVGLALDVADFLAEELLRDMELRSFFL